MLTKGSSDSITFINKAFQDDNILTDSVAKLGLEIALFFNVEYASMEL